ncbi:MAG TPA: hypothetical protein P5133_02945 [Spirochaetia bacterium]|nr:hypothetical protein [Spirochaetia bacterium]HRZ63858.1 hypothetical protein [Spirochaetia bacterium]
MGEEPIGAGIGRGGVSPLRLLAALCLPLILGGCGVEEYIYFYPPTTNSNPVLSIAPLEFSHNSSNDSSTFLGYEVYYLLVDESNTTFLSECSSKVDAYIGTKTPSELIAAIKSLGFKPLVGFTSSDDSSVMNTFPLFLIGTAGLSQDIDFDVNINDEGTVVVSGDGASEVTAPHHVRRNSKNSSSEYRSFGNLKEDDVGSDGDTAYASAEPATVLFRGYVFGYGTTASWGEVFSVPVRVGDSDEPALSGSFDE